MLHISDKLTAITGLGLQTAKRLNKLGLITIQDLLLHFPARYEDFSKTVPIAQAKLGEQITIQGKIQTIVARASRTRRLTITEALISDASSSVKAIWFNQPYLTQSLASGQEIMLAGKITASNYGWQIEQPNWELVTKEINIHTGRLVPFYPLTAGLTHYFFRKIFGRVINLVSELPDLVPLEIRQNLKIPPLATALKNLHFPTNQTDLITARRRVAFDELYFLSLASRLAHSQTNNLKAPTIPFSPATKKIVSELPWSLTSDQKKSAWEIIQDLGKPQPMHRLLQGEVGSGKTIVAGLAAFNAIQAGYQVVILAPTEILAVQHFHTLTNLFANWPIKCALLTRGHKTTNFETKSTKLKILNQLKNGEIKIIIGTHALLSDKIHFNKLGLVVIDEQHRFGVEQRQWLTKDINFTPHLLSLSATPIPRSLALTIFGDLNISIIKQMPTGRQPISTLIVPPQKRTGAYNFIRQEIKLGHRAFIICPLVEESDVLGVRAVTSEYEKLSREIFPDIKIGLLHGRLKAKDKTEIMAEFKNGTKPILISTSVVEVGVDIPEATIMMIEGAERFGIAQLHQFRGRVGRSTLKSYCLLFTDTQSEQSLKRLQALTKYQNGFDLAEFDLKKRGPGDFLGEVQSGWGKLKFAELIDLKLLDSVRAATTMTLALDATLTNFPELKNKLAELNFHPE